MRRGIELRPRHLRREVLLRGVRGGGGVRELFGLGGRGSARRLERMERSKAQEDLGPSDDDAAVVGRQRCQRLLLLLWMLEGGILAFAGLWHGVAHQAKGGDQTSSVCRVSGGAVVEIKGSLVKLN